VCVCVCVCAYRIVHNDDGGNTKPADHRSVCNNQSTCNRNLWVSSCCNHCTIITGWPSTDWRVLSSCPWVQLTNYPLNSVPKFWVFALHLLSLTTPVSESVSRWLKAMWCCLRETSTVVVLGHSISCQLINACCPVELDVLSSNLTFS